MSPSVQARNHSRHPSGSSSRAIDCNHYQSVYHITLSILIMVCPTPTDHPQSGSHFFLNCARTAIMVNLKNWKKEYSFSHSLFLSHLTFQLNSIRPLSLLSSFFPSLSLIWEDDSPLRVLTICQVFFRYNKWRRAFSKGWQEGGRVEDDHLPRFAWIPHWNEVEIRSLEAIMILFVGWTAAYFPIEFPQESRSWLTN